MAGIWLGVCYVGAAMFTPVVSRLWCHMPKDLSECTSSSLLHLPFSSSLIFTFLLISHSPLFLPLVGFSFSTPPYPALLLLPTLPHNPLHLDQASIGRPPRPSFLALQERNSDGLPLDVFVEGSLMCCFRVFQQWTGPPVTPKGAIVRSTSSTARCN